MEVGSRISKMQALSAVRGTGAVENGGIGIGKTGKSGITKVGQTAGMAGMGGAGETEFRDYLKDAIQKNQAVFQEGGDVVMGYPPLMAAKYGVDMAKPVEDMTMDEYKRYICNRVSALSVSTGMRIGGSGVLVFKEEAFESMKGNREYEEAVLGMLAEKCAEEVPTDGFHTPKVSYQVIGASMEESYGAEIPVKNYGLSAGLTGFAMASGLAGQNPLYGLTGINGSLYGLTGINGALYGLTGINGSLYGLMGQNGALYGLTGMGDSLYGMAGSLYGMAGLGGYPLAGGSGFLSGVAGMPSAYGASGSTVNRSNMVNAYRKTLEGKSGDTSIRRYMENRREN